MAQDASERPREVTTATLIAGGGSALLVMSSLVTAGSLRTVEVRHRMVTTLARSSWGDAGLDVDQVIGALRVLLLVASVSAAVVLVLSVFAARRDPRARVGLTVAAIPLVVAGLLGGQILAAVVPVAVGMLWSGRAGDWFAGRPLREPRRSPSPGAAGPPGANTVSSPDRPDVWAPPRQPGFPSHQTQPGAPVPTGQTERPAPWPPPGQYRVEPGAASRVPRPGELVGACAITWAMTGFCALACTLGIVTLLALPEARLHQLIDPALERYPDVGTSMDTVVTAVSIILLVALVWSVLAAALAWWTFAGSTRGRLGLTLNAAWCALVCLGMGFAAPVLWLVAMAAVAVVGLLRSPPCARWFDTRPRSPR